MVTVVPPDAARTPEVRCSPWAGELSRSTLRSPGSSCLDVHATESSISAT